MTAPSSSPGSTTDLPLWWFDTLLVGHDPGDPAEATLVLAAAAAANGLRCDGELMDGGTCGVLPSMRDISRQTNLSIDAVRRGVQHLIGVNAVVLDGGISVDPEALAGRWSSYRQRLRITTEMRLLRLRPKPLLLAALVAGQCDRQRRLCLGIPYLMERTGFPRRTLDRALSIARSAGAVHSWVRPTARGSWQLYLAPGPSQRGARDTSQRGVRDDDSGRTAPADRHAGPSVRRKEAQTPVAKGRGPHREEAQTPSQRGARTPDCPPESPPDSPPDLVPASPVGESRAAPSASPEPAPDPVKGAGNVLGPAEVHQAVDRWVAAFARKGIDQLTDAHAFDVAGLLDQMGPRPAVIRNHRAFAEERRDFARNVIAWCPSVERLGRWLVRCARWFGVENLTGYLRRACAKGDPGTVLESHSKNILGRAVETLRDFSRDTERVLEGPHAAGVKRITATLAVALGEVDDAKRQQLRAELRACWAQQQPAAARVVLLRLVGDDRSDVTIQRATEGILTLHEARRLLEAV